VRGGLEECREETAHAGAGGSERGGAEAGWAAAAAAR